MMYDQGEGVPQNDMRAYMWYSLAAERSTDASDTYAADRRDNVFSRMTPAQIAEAQKLARE
jgi:TPR repeat protein